MKTDLEKVPSPKPLPLKRGDRYEVTIFHRRSERTVSVEVEEDQGLMVRCAVIGGDMTTLVKPGARLSVARSRFLPEKKL